MEIVFEKAKSKDLFEIEKLYNLLNDHLEETINYPGWIKSVYPTIETAKKGLEDNSIFVARTNGEIVASVILNSEQEEDYELVEWGVQALDEEVLVIHTLAVHPKYLKLGVGKAIMNFAKGYAMEKGMKAIRLDISKNNIPAKKMYEKFNFQYIGNIDKWLLYELNLHS